jgi:hypothetical protein
LLFATKRLNDDVSFNLKDGATTFSITTSGITTLSIKTLSIMGLIATISINDIQHSAIWY